MQPRSAHLPDWRDAASYAPLLDADRSILAWEWLRRDPDYRAAAEAALGPAGGEAGREGPFPKAARWGLHAFEAPGLPAPLARPMWSATAHPAVLAAVASGTGEATDLLDLRRLAPIVSLVDGHEQGEHLLLSNGFRTIRLDVLAGTLAQGPVRLRYLLAGFASAEMPLLTLRRLMALARTGRFARSLHPREPRTRRWLLMLRAHDALAKGADQREIAAVLLSSSARQSRWRSQAPSLRPQVQRLVRGARFLAEGGYRELLG